MSAVRRPAVADLFYPAEPMQLKQMVSGYLQKAKVKLAQEQKLRILVAPHAGYVYSGPVAGTAYKQLDTLDKTRHWKVFLIGPAHRVALNGVSVCAFDAFQMPFGNIAVSPVAKELAQKLGFVPGADALEHSLEVQLPFLQAALPSFELIPMVIGRANPQALAEVLAPYLDEDSLLVVSTDLSHFFTYEKALRVDALANESIPKLDIETFAREGDACGRVGVLAAMHIAREKQWQGTFLDYQNSGDTSGDKSRVVGYGAYCFSSS